MSQAKLLASKYHRKRFYDNKTNKILRINPKSRGYRTYQFSKTPLDPKQTIELNTGGNKGNKSNAYACPIGALQYLATATCPDIVFAVNRLSAFAANPSISHQTAIKWILRYSSGTKSFGITYRKTTTQKNNLFHGYHKSLYSDNSPVHRYLYIRKESSFVMSSIMLLYLL